MISFISSKIKNQFIRINDYYKWYLYYKYSKNKLYTFDNSIFINKSVAIIGGADSAFKNKLGSYIDKFDIVIRINKGVEMIEKYHEYIGTRTDVLFHSFYDKVYDQKNSSPFTIDLWKDMNVGQVVCSYNTSDKHFKTYFRDFFVKTKGILKVYQLGQIDFNENFRVLQPNYPTNGFSAINTVLNANPKEVYITGFTFFKTIHSENYRNIEEKELMQIRKGIGGNSHNADKEYQYIRTQYLNSNGIIKVDSTLQAIFDKVEN